MRAMALIAAARGRLDPVERPVPTPGPCQVRVRVRACGVCRTDLHVVDGELPDIPIPIVPGHEVVGIVDALGSDVSTPAIGDRVGIPWLGWTCRSCAACAAGHENLCPIARFTGYQIDGGYAEYAVVDALFALPLPDGYSDEAMAPLLCAGLIGYRAYRMAGPGRRLGLYGFGAAAHILAQVAVQDGREVFAFTTPGDTAAQAFARRLGAVWAGDSTVAPPAPLDAAIVFAPVGALVPEALGRTAPGGTVVCAGIHMSDIPSFPYRLLWEERSVRSVANLTREDGRLFLGKAASMTIHTHTTAYPLGEANAALADLREGRLEGAAVLMP
jgi:propanol-preferring alcohol dehydrogenase